MNPPTACDPPWKIVQNQKIAAAAKRLWLGEKQCSLCKQTKELSAFYIQKNRLDRCTPACKKCLRAYYKARRSPLTHEEHLAMYARLKASGITASAEYKKMRCQDQKRLREKLADAYVRNKLNIRKGSVFDTDAVIEVRRLQILIRRTINEKL